MKKYKELRYCIVLILLLFLIGCGFIYGFITHSVSKMIISGSAFLISIFFAIMNFNVMIGDTFLVTYDFMILFMYPHIIDYKDIKQVSIVNKHVLLIETIKTKKKMYIFNSEKVYQTIQEKMEEYKLRETSK